MRTANPAAAEKVNRTNRFQFPDTIGMLADNLAWNLFVHRSRQMHGIDRRRSEIVITRIAFSLTLRRTLAFARHAPYRVRCTTQFTAFSAARFVVVVWLRLCDVIRLVADARHFIWPRLACAHRTCLLPEPAHIVYGLTCTVVRAIPYASDRDRWRRTRLTWPKRSTDRRRSLGDTERMRGGRERASDGGMLGSQPSQKRSEAIFLAEQKIRYNKLMFYV